MKVLLLSDVQTLGKKGEVKEVSEGYARNFLIRQGLAEIVTPKTMEMLQARKRKAEKIKVNEAKEHKKIFNTLNRKSIVVAAKVAGGTTLYSAVSPAQIADEIEEVFKIEIEPKQIVIENPIKTVGTYNVIIECDKDLNARLAIQVEALD